MRIFAIWASRIRGRPGSAKLKDYRYDPVAHTDAVMAQADTARTLAGLNSQNRELLPAELIRLAQSDADWIEGRHRPHYE